MTEGLTEQVGSLVTIWGGGGGNLARGCIELLGFTPLKFRSQLIVLYRYILCNMINKCIKRHSSMFEHLSS